MKMKKSSLLILLLACLLVVVGCEKEETVESGGETINVTSMQHKHCTRAGNATGATVNLNYDLYYTGEILNIIQSEEQVVSDDAKTLDTYEEAYKKIHSNYEGLDYYDTEVIREDNSVTSHITINYDKVDIDKLLEIEGEEDNIIENGQAKVDKWLELMKNFGTKCEIVDDKNSEE